MEEQFFLDFEIRFNLRERNSKKATIIYAVVCFKGKQWKINSGVKVTPKFWNMKKQIAVCGNGLSPLDNHNNNIANNRLKQILIANEEIKNYLCQNIDSLNDNGFYNSLKRIINPQMKNKIMGKEKLSATLIMKKIVEQKNIAESSKQTYYNKIDSLKKFFKEKDIKDNLSSINLSIIEYYQSYLIENNHNPNSINQYVSTLKSIFKKISKYKEYGFDYHNSGLEDIDIYKGNLSRQTKRDKQIALTEDDITVLYEYPLNGKEAEIRDIFVCQCFLGQRIGDMAKLFKNGYTVDEENNTISFLQQKKKETAIIPLFPIAKALLEKYKNGFEYINFNSERFDNNINVIIKRIAKKAKLVEIKSYTEQKGKDVRIVTKPLYEMIHTHTARHSFITIMCRNNVPKDTVIIATGHTDTKMIDDVYLHQTKEDKTKKVVEGFSNLNSTIFKIDNILSESEQQNYKNVAAKVMENRKGKFTPNTDNDLVQEAKEVLTYLGADSFDFQDINDIDELHRLLYGQYESKILDLGVDYKLVKEIYNNKDKTLRERHNELQNLIEQIKSKIIQ